MFYGWILMPALCLIYGIGLGGPLLGQGVALPAIAKAHDWPMGQAATAVSFLILSMGATGPIVGRLMTRFSARLIMVIGGLLIAAGATITTLTDSLVMYYLGGGVVMGLGIGSLVTVAGPTLIGRWFVRRRALMMAFYFTSSGLASFFLAPLSGYLLDMTQNWRTPYILMACCGLVGSLLALIFVRERPADLGQFPDGAAAAPQGAAATSAHEPSKPTVISRVFTTASDWQVSDVLRSPAFWCVAFTWACYGIGVQIILSQLVAHLKSVGVATTLAASALGTVTLASSGGKLLSGVFGDRVEPRYLLTSGILIQLLAVVLLVNSEQAVPLLYTFAVMFGIGYGLCFVTISVLFTNYYGAGPFPTVYGLAYMTQVGVSALSVPIAGYIFHSAGTYRPVLLGIIAILAAGAISAFSAVPRASKRIGAVASITG